MAKWGPDTPSPSPPPPPPTPPHILPWRTPSYLQVCLVAKKGADPPGTRRGVLSDVIYSERRGQSQKPEEIYQLVEALVPNGGWHICVARQGWVKYTCGWCQSQKT